ncbi:hypothetical protein [Lacinutrix mariniflava]|uniref:hypothetical protein n=1 Tax=Lacinutrix mariniflava TaxID=342955 RepID=UPI0006E12942|nr:hypothetical protein [Lacinutrix mariniflava]
MKNNNYIKLLVLPCIIALLASCVNDDDVFGDNTNKATAVTTVTELMIFEGGTGLIPFTISNPINKTAKFRIDVVSGSAEEDTDYTAGTGDIVGENGISGEGFEMIVPAYAESFEIPVSTILDLDQTEGTETITLKISATGNRTILTPVPYLVNVTIVDFTYCMWDLQVLDAYGDSWQGATITIEDDHHTATYPTEDWNDFEELYQIPVGTNYAFTYTSGTTGDQPNVADAPGYEEENSYTLTATNGTVYSDGPVPTVGIIASGADSCN